jgi:hypothetical protein
MSLLINDDLIWVATPKCASVSIKESLLSSNLNIVHHSNAIKLSKRNRHAHVRIHDLFSEFGTKETICIKRDWFDRWLSALKHLSTNNFPEDFTPVYKWEDFTNELIYKIFDKNFTNLLYSGEKDDLEEPFLRLFNGDNISKNNYGIMMVLASQNFWTENQKCTYEFDIKEIDKVEEFFKNRYGCDLKIQKLNEATNLKSKIVVNDELKAFVWDLFEKPFIKRDSIL